ncbi:MAG: VWA domain-containing protein [Thermoanaerobaculia bacterium]
MTKSKPRNLPGSLTFGLVALLTVVLLAPGNASAQRKAAKKKGKDKFSETTTVVVVEIPVTVVKDGEPIRGLTAEDFQVSEGRKKHPIVGFNEVDLSLEGAPLSAAEIPIAARRHFLFMFDLSLSDPAKIARARHAALELVEESLHPADLAGVATYSTSQGLKMPLGFTSDRYQLRLAIETLGLPQLVHTTRDPLGILLTGLDTTAAIIDSPGASAAGTARGGLDPEAEILELLSTIETEVRREEQRDQILALTSSLAELAGVLKSVQGRKHVVFLSEGFDSTALTGIGMSTLGEQQRAQEQTDAAMAGRIWEVDSNARFGDTSTQNVLGQMAEAFVKADCTIQAVDIGGLDAGGAVTGTTADAGTARNREAGMHWMASQTGGEYYRNFNQPAQAMGRMLNATSVTYLLAIQPENLQFDGEYRRLKVKVNNVPRGARVVHKPGYFAPTEFAEQNPFARRLNTAGLILGGDSGGAVDTAVLAAPFPMGLGNAYVPVLIEVGGPSLLAGQVDEVMPTEIYAYAIDSMGTVRDYFSRVLAFDMKKTPLTLEQQGLKYWGHFELPTGDYVLRVMVRNGTTGAFGIDKVPMRVPDFDISEVAISQPLFPEPVGKWLLVREKAEEQADVPYPFLAGETPFIPAAKPTLNAREITQLLLVGFNLGSGAIELSGEVYTLDGSRIGQRAISIDDRPLTEASYLDRLIAMFDPGQLDAGEYKLVVTLSDGESGEERTASIPFVVGG